ncbi:MULTISPECIES: restriction endonuclease subunit S [Mammaliicoccus]|uniref:Restriction endonuclease subunit S n=1 Tax=Mammaliicoccus sciuri TaxID=1296 RepID=A0ABT7HYD1_MAMSC|nr:MULTISPECIES: restriction endonuclease subunit S [Mammaliicoccus]MDL0112721.1 restriction endonuclease subunit S [Mammaliicoccus sciuri]MDL0117159.1 restriction endonuclease subunit S [Mammaliicoccus sciuri]
MTNQTKNVPELRFPEFDGEWENSKLGTVANVYDGTHQTPKYTSEGIKFLSVENIKTLNSNKFISKEAFEKEFKIRPEFGDVLMTRIGDVGTPNVVETNEHLAYYVSLALLKPKKLNSYFLESLIRSQSVQNELWRKTLHIAFPKKINKNEIAKVEINYPEQQEQQKIGEFFRKLDRQIELEEQKLAKLEEQKKGYMQKIFSQELRFKDENGNEYPEWEEKTLGDIGSVAMNKRIYKNETTNHGEIPFYKIGTFGKKAETFISREKFEEYKEKYPYPNKGDILISASGSIGRTVEYDGEEAYYQDSNIVWLQHNNEVLNVFLKYFYLIVKWNGIEGTTIKRLYNKNILNTKIKLPVKEEQQKIGVFLERIDSLIEKQSNKVGFLKQRKQGLLQKMFI